MIFVFKVKRNWKYLSSHYNIWQH